MNGNNLMLIHLHIDLGQSRRDSSKTFHNALYTNIFVNKTKIIGVHVTREYYFSISTSECHV